MAKTNWKAPVKRPVVAPKGHGAAKLPKLDKTHSAKSSEIPQKRTSIPSINRSVDGLYVPVQIHGKEYKFLVDTGASDSYISRRVYEQIDERIRPPLKHKEAQAHLADGSTLPLDGDVTLELAIGPSKGTVLVADVSGDGILGLETLTQMGAKIDLTRFEFTTKWGKIECKNEDGEKLLCQISASEQPQFQLDTKLLYLDQQKVESDQMH